MDALFASTAFRQDAQPPDGSALQFQVEPQVAAVARDTNILAILV
jgi:hypothetical protein